MATIFDPQNFSTDFLINSVNTYNNLTDENRSQYTDMTSFVPLQTDSANFSTTMKDPGFVKYMTAPIAEKAKGPTVTVQEAQSTAKTPSAEEILARMEAGQPMFYEGEDLPTYDPKSGMSPGQFWSQYPPLTYAGQGLKGTIYGLSDSQQKEVEEAPNIQAAPVDEVPAFSPAGHPGQVGSVVSGLTGQVVSHPSSFSEGIKSGFMDMNPATGKFGFSSKSQSDATVSAYGVQGIPTSYGEPSTGSTASTSSVAAPTPTGAAAHGAQAAGMAGMANAAAHGAQSAGMAGMAAAAAATGGGAATGGPGPGPDSGGNKKKGGKVTLQMNNLQSGGKITVESPDENARQIIQNMQARQGSNVKIVRSKKGHFLGAVDLNDTNQHYISNMDQFDTALGIIKPYEQAMASDPRQAAQLGRKRNWKNRSAILNSVYLSQYPVTPEPESDDRRTIELLRQQRQGENRDFEQGPSRTRTGDYRSVYDAGVRRAVQEVGREPFESGTHSAYKTYGTKKDHLTSMEDKTSFTEMPLTQGGARKDPVGHGSRKSDARPVEYPASQPQYDHAITPPATSDALQKAEGFMRETLETDPGWTPPPRSDAGPTPINRGEPYVRLEDPVQKSEPQTILEAVLPAYNPEDNPDKSNNPGNVKAVKEDFHQQSGITEDGFAQFTDPRWGLRTLFMTLLQPRYKNKTISEIANTYSPHKNERGKIENTVEEIQGKIQVIAQELAKFGITDANSKVDLNDPQILAALARAIIKSEKVPEEAEYYLNLPQDVWEYAQKTAPIDMQAGGQVPQINQSGFIQGPGSPVSDSIPMEAEPGSFIVNAPATQMIGQNKLNAMTNNTSTAKNTKSSVDPQGINVSNGEFKVSKPDAERIGYDNLNRINDAGKPFVEQLDRKGYAEGGVPLPVRKPMQVTFGDKTVQVTDEEIKGLAKLLYLEDQTGVISEDVLGVVINRMNAALNSKKGKGEFIGNKSINLMNIIAKPDAFQPVSKREINGKITPVINGDLQFDVDYKDDIKKAQQKNPKVFSDLEQVIRNTFNEVNAKTYHNPAGKSLWFQNKAASEDSTLSKNVDNGYFNIYSIRHIPQEKGKDKKVEFYEVNPDKEKVIASKKLNFDSAFDRNFYNKAREFNYDTSIPTPVFKPESPDANKSFISSPNEQAYAQAQPDEPVNLLDIPEDSSKPKIQERTFISPGGSNVYPPTDITLPPNKEDVDEYNKFKETFYN